MASEVSKSIQFICSEKGLEESVVMEAVESALAAAYRKDFGNRQQNIEVKFDPETGDIQAWDVKTVAEDISEEDLEKSQEELATRREEARKKGREMNEEEMDGLVRFNPKTQIMLSEAKKIKKDVKIDEVLRIVLEIPGDFGRMAAQTAKQVIIQKLREAERNTVFNDFKEQEGHIVQGIIQRRDRGGALIIDLGKITGILPSTEQIFRENYRPGGRMKFFVSAVAIGARGPEIILSRSSKKMVEEIFEKEIPEIADKVVMIKGIARDAGNRSKVAVSTDDDTIDPIGSCIGQRGSRITTIIDELGGEKIDVIQYSKNTEEYIKQALSPAKIASVKLNEETKEAEALVAADQFSLAIGRGGQNVRLAAELTGWKIKVIEDSNEGAVVSSEDGEDIIKSTQVEPALAEEVTEKTEPATEKIDEENNEETETIAENASEETK